MNRDRNEIGAFLHSILRIEFAVCRDNQFLLRNSIDIVEANKLRG